MAQTQTTARIPRKVALLKSLFKNRLLHGHGIRYLDSRARKFFLEEERHLFPPGIQKDKYDLVIGLLHGFDRAFRCGAFAPEVLDKTINNLLGNILLGREVRAEAAGKLGFAPPLFCVISPTKRCNLRCVGCYASSDATSNRQLSYEVFTRILREKQERWGSFFTVISGGEPFMWRNAGKDILDIAAEFPDQYFLVYTNGTLIDEKTAERLFKAGNVTPAISVEGFSADTDARRGTGVFDRILRAFSVLRAAGVPFGISATATKHNWRTVTSSRFVDFYFRHECASYGWLFQYMPIGRRHTLDLMVTPEQRLSMFRRTWRRVREQKVFYADFWNSGTASNGCIAGGRSGGYFYINWDGDVTPCVFIPYSTHNINDVYASGGNLDTVVLAPLFEKIRQWQYDYGYEKDPGDVNNWLCPCAIRDHFGHFLEVCKSCDARPIDDEAAAAIDDPEYCSGLMAYGKTCDELTRHIWDSRYKALAPGGQPCAVGIGDAKSVAV